MKNTNSRRGKVYFIKEFAGIIEQKEDEFIFTYDALYLKSENAQPISLTLPLKKEAYASKTMIPFFDGLIPEGWLLDVAAQTWKVALTDRMGLLLTVCKDCIGAVSIYPINEEENSDATS